MAKTLDPQHIERLHAEFAGQGLMSHIGARLGDFEAGRCEIILPWRSAVGQQHGFFHGGVIGAIADTAAGFAAYTMLPQDSAGLTAEYKINFLRPAKGDHLSARAEVVRAGRSMAVCRADVYAVSGDDETLCATALLTMARVDLGKVGKADAQQN